MTLDDRIGRVADESARLFEDVEVPEFTPPRRGSLLVGAGVLAIVAASILLVAILRPDLSPDPDPVVFSTSTTTTTATPDGAVVLPPPIDVQPVVSSLDVAQPVPLRVFVVHPRLVESAVIDLETATVTRYLSEVDAWTGSADGAVATPNRELVVWTYEPAAYVFSDGLAAADLELHPEPNLGSGFAPALRVVPTPDGDMLWVVQPGVAYGDSDVATLVELVELPTGRRLATFEVEPNAFPAGATDAGLVLNTETLVDAGDGWVVEPGSERIVVVDADGSVTKVGAGRALAASTNTIVRRVCDSHNDCELIIGDGAGTVPRPGDGMWAPVGGPAIPSAAMPLQSISPDGTSLLVAYGEDLDLNGTPARSTLYVVDVRNRTTRVVASFAGRHPLATWSADGRWIAVIETRDITLYSAEDPASFFTVANAIPDGHFPFAAG